MAKVMQWPKYMQWAPIPLQSVGQELHLDIAPTSEHLHIALKKAAYSSSNQRCTYGMQDILNAQVSIVFESILESVFESSVCQ